MTPEAALDRGLARLDLAAPNDAGGRLLAYLALLAKWNRVYNLTAIRDPLRAVTHHLLDSLAVLPHLRGGALADVGAGAGLPGIPLALCRPQWSVTLVERSEKRVAFLRQAAIELRLANVRIHAGRAEDWRPAARFSTVISRAFSSLGTFARACGHLVAEDGMLAAMKGAHPGAELEALPPGISTRGVLKLEVPLLDAERHLVLLSAAPREVAA